MDHDEIVDGALFVACCHAPGLLEAIDQALDPVSLAVGVAVEIRLTERVGMTGRMPLWRKRRRAVGLL